MTSLTSLEVRVWGSRGWRFGIGVQEFGVQKVWGAKGQEGSSTSGEKCMGKTEDGVDDGRLAHVGISRQRNCHIVPLHPFLLLYDVFVEGV